MTQCGAPILQGICPSRTGELFEIGLKWGTVWCLLTIAVATFQCTMLNCSEWR